MTLEWIGDAVLLLVVLPVVIYLLYGVLARGEQDRAERPADRLGSRTPASRTSTQLPLLLTTQEQVTKTIEAAADYGGSLDVIVDDA